jgi:hypothetical protein
MTHKNSKSVCCKRLEISVVILFWICFLYSAILPLMAVLGTDICHVLPFFIPIGKGIGSIEFVRFASLLAVRC